MSDKTNDTMNNIDIEIQQFSVEAGILASFKYDADTINVAISAKQIQKYLDEFVPVQSIQPAAERQMQKTKYKDQTKEIVNKVQQGVDKVQQGVDEKEKAEKENAKTQTAEKQTLANRASNNSQKLKGLLAAEIYKQKKAIEKTKKNEKPKKGVFRGGSDTKFEVGQLIEYYKNNDDKWIRAIVNSKVEAEAEAEAEADKYTIYKGSEIKELNDDRTELITVDDSKIRIPYTYLQIRNEIGDLFTKISENKSAIETTQDEELKTTNLYEIDAKITDLDEKMIDQKNLVETHQAKVKELQAKLPKEKENEVLMLEYDIENETAKITTIDSQHENLNAAILKFENHTRDLFNYNAEKDKNKKYQTTLIADIESFNKQIQDNTQTRIIASAVAIVDNDKNYTRDGADEVKIIIDNQTVQNNISLKDTALSINKQNIETNNANIETKNLEIKNTKSKINTLIGKIGVGIEQINEQTEIINEEKKEAIHKSIKEKKEAIHKSIESNQKKLTNLMAQNKEYTNATKLLNKYNTEKKKH